MTAASVTSGWRRAAIQPQLVRRVAGDLERVVAAAEDEQWPSASKHGEIAVDPDVFESPPIGIEKRSSPSKTRGPSLSTAA